MTLIYIDVEHDRPYDTTELPLEHKRQPALRGSRRI